MCGREGEMAWEYGQVEHAKVLLPLLLPSEVDEVI
jgi:hypothetical protein